MAELWVKYDTSVARYKATSVAPGGFIDEEFDIVAEGGVTELTMQVGTVTSSNKIDVFFNGQKKREGETQDWTRNVAQNKIQFNYTVPKNVWVEIRLYS